MLISFAEQTFKLNAWGTKRELAYTLANCDAGSMTLGEDIEEPHKFYSVIAYLEWPKTDAGHFGIGICSEDHGLVPHLLLQPRTDLVVCGFNSEAVGIDIKSTKTNFRILLDSLFSSFVSLTRQKVILIFHEIGVVAITQDGKELWRYSQDVIVDYKIREDSLELNFMDSPPLTLDLGNGKVI